MKGLIKSEKGSSSILVAMVLIILVVFSALAVTTSLSNLRLAEKNAGTVKVFYNLDASGELFLSDIYYIILSSKNEAAETIALLIQGSINVANLPESIGITVEKTYGDLSGEESRQKYIKTLYPKLANYFSVKSIEEAYHNSITDEAADYLNDETIYAGNDVNLSFNIKRTIVMEYEQSHRYLNMTLAITNPEENKPINEICAILEWRLWQEPFEYKNEVDLWEGIP